MSRTDVPERIHLLREVAADLARAYTEADVAHAVLNPVNEHLGAVTAALWLLTPDEQTLTCAYERNVQAEAISRYATVTLDLALPGPEVVRTGEPAFVASRAERDARWPAVAGTPTAAEALALLPLAVSSRCLGLVAFGFESIRAFDDEDRATLFAVADQCAIALDRARLYQAARADADANEVLARIAATTGTRDWQDVAADIAAICCAGFVDTCGVYIREGSLVRRVAGTSRTYPETFGSMVDRYPIAMNSPSPIAVSIRAARPVHGNEPSVRVDAASSGAPGYPEVTAQLTFSDAWIVPLLDAGRAFGAMLFATGPDDPAMDDERVQFAQQIAHRAATALRTVTEFGEHRAAVDRLHEVLLPDRVPEVPGWELAASYVPDTVGPTIGGDWWDAFQLPNGFLALTVGDVAGHGVSVATLTAQLRNAFRSELVRGMDPAGAMKSVSALLDWSAPDAHATAIVARVDPLTGTVVWSSAGHPPPLVVEPDGTAEFLDVVSAPPLGVLHAPGHRAYSDHRRRLAVGATLHLYTDGLVESRKRSLDEGFAALAKEAAARRTDPLTTACDRLVTALVDRPEDDICLLMARWVQRSV